MSRARSATAAQAATTTTAPAVVSDYEAIRAQGVTFIAFLMPYLFNKFNSLYTSAKEVTGFNPVEFWHSVETRKAVFKELATKTGEKKSNKMIGAFIRLTAPLIDLGIRSLARYNQILSERFSNDEGKMFETAYAFTPVTSMTRLIAQAVILPDGIAYHGLQDSAVAHFNTDTGAVLAARKAVLGKAIGQDIVSASQLVATVKNLDAWKARLTVAKAEDKDATIAKIPYAELAV